MKLQPENQIQHSLELVASLGKLYGIAVIGYIEASFGIENTTLIVSSHESKYVFRIYRQAKKTDEQIHAEINFIDYLSANGIPVPSIRSSRAGNAITIFEAVSHHWQLIVMDFILGSHPKVLSIVLLAEIATTQAHMHILAANYIDRSGSLRKLTELVETEFITQIDVTSIDTKLRAFLERGATYRVALDVGVTTGPCHLDYDELNILCRDESITAVLDFDDMAIAPYVVCLAYTLWHIQDEHGKVMANAYLRLYEQIRPLTDPERRLLPAAMLFRHYVITAIRILYGETSPENIKSYLQVERSLLSSVT